MPGRVTSLSGASCRKCRCRPAGWWATSPRSLCDRPLGAVDALDLYVLLRRLGKIGEAALEGPGTERLSPAVALVLGDVLTHPGSSISETTARTGFPQSYVSKSVSRLRGLRVVETVADRGDGRRTLVRPTRTAVRRIGQRATAPFEATLLDALGTDDPTVVADRLRAGRQVGHRRPVVRAARRAGRIADPDPVRRPADPTRFNGTVFRLWEAPGTSHVDAGLDALLAAESGTPPTPCALPANDGQQSAVMDAALARPDHWIRTGVAAPAAPRIQVTPDGTAIARDRDGNALGGVRTPALQAPTATLTGAGNTGTPNRPPPGQQPPHGDAHQSVEGRSLAAVTGLSRPPSATASRPGRCATSRPCSLR